MSQDNARQGLDSFKRIGDLVVPIAPKRLSHIKRRWIESSIAIEKDDSSHPAFQHSVFCQIGMPYRDPGATVREWERRQGMVSLLIEAGRTRHPETGEWLKLGLPFGPKPRLILAYLNAQALRTGSPSIAVEDSLTAFIRRIGLASKGNNMRLIKDQLNRLSAATIRLGIANGKRSLNVNLHIVSAFDLWLVKDDRQRVLWPSTVHLSPTTLKAFNTMPSPSTSGPSPPRRTLP